MSEQNSATTASTMDSPESGRCRNCGRGLSGHHCTACGQEDKDLLRPFFYLLRDTLRAVFDFDGRAYRTAGLLLTRPAYVSRDYLAGRRNRYTPPLRFFLFVSISFFLLVTVIGSVQDLRESVVAAGSTATEPAELEAIEEQAPELAPDTENPDTEGEDADADLRGLNEFIDGFNLALLSDAANSNLRAFMRTQAAANYQSLVENPREALYGMLEYLTVLMLVMMPVMALIQRLLYLGTGHYYIEHLILTLHNHSFVIMMLALQIGFALLASLDVLIISPLFGLLEALTLPWLFLYLYLSLKKMFGYGYFLTALIFLIASLLYLLIATAGTLLLGMILFFLF